MYSFNLTSCTSVAHALPSVNIPRDDSVRPL